MRKSIKTIKKNGYTFVYNNNTTGNEKYPYMIHIYNSKGSCIFYKVITWSQDTTWTYEYMNMWFDKWLKEN